MTRSIQKYLQTKIIARNIKEYEILDSTQEMAKTMIGKEPHGTMILTKQQTNGIGTHQRKWYTNPNDNITFTLILYPNCKISELEGITIQIAECIKKALKELYNIEVKIKEPNDIMLNNKKLAGILTQTSTIEEQVQYLLIGIGLNVNQTEFINEIEEIATSLKKEYQTEFEKEKIIAEICNKIEENLKF